MTTKNVSDFLREIDSGECHVHAPIPGRTVLGQQVYADYLVDARLYIASAPIMRALASKAVRNKSGKATLLNVALVVRATIKGNPEKL